mmetsp:Transcript_33413/g.77586  ORF Transcript_33413/g.77586 Transcript_33413/m.77586 type:complete len:445 (+) Transcript_33413:147-1481(+)
MLPAPAHHGFNNAEGRGGGWRTERWTWESDSGASQVMNWSCRQLEEDVEAFLTSGGKIVPQMRAKAAGETCSLLTRLRLQLAKQGIRKAPCDYAAFARHFGARNDPNTLPGASQLSPVEAGVWGEAAALVAPRVLDCPQQWAGRRLHLGYWRSEHGDWQWPCRARTPLFGTDVADSPEGLCVMASVAEYAEYAELLARKDRNCSECCALAYPRVTMDMLPVFCGEASRVCFQRLCEALLPPGVDDLTARWARMFGSLGDIGGEIDWEDCLTQFYRISISAPGGVSRLRRENNFAHVWLAQTHGSKLVFLFSPQESKHLYEESLRPSVLEPCGCALSTSPVDIFFPDALKHPNFALAKAQSLLLEAGQMLIIPSGWWWYAVAMRPSVTLHKRFYNKANRHFMAQDLMDGFQLSDLDDRMHEALLLRIQRFREMVSEDDGVTDWDG